MPFTFSHPALVLPFSYLPRRWASMTGLVIGSMAPDFEYFMRMRVTSIYSHSLLGLLWFDLPLGLLLFFIYDRFVKDALIDHLPLFLNERLSKFRRNAMRAYSLRFVLVLTISVLAGAASHILWDGFTHPSGYFVTRVPALQASVRIAGHQFYWYTVLQHFSTLVGGATIVAVLLSLPEGNDTRTGSLGGYWSTVFAIAAAIMALRFRAGIDLHQYGNLLVTAISAGMIGLLATSLFVQKTSMMQNDEQ